jgi:hypothetical protein
MTPAEEKARLASVQLALELLLARGPQTRAELFGETKDSAVREFQRKTIRTLELQGIVYKADSGTPPMSRVHLKNRKKAQFVLENPIELAGIVWPSSRPAPPPDLVNPPAPQEPVVLIVEEDEERAPQEQVAFITARPMAAPVDVTPQGTQQKKEESKPVEQAPAPVLTPSIEPSTRELLERLLVVMDAACQSIIYTREKIDALEPKINHLWEQLK